MRILLIGGGGQIGHEILKLAIHSHEVFAPSSYALNILEYNETKRIIDSFLPDIVINASAYHDLSACEQYSSKAFDTNAYAVENLANICFQNQIQLITFSTNYVFSGNKKIPYSESDLTDPLQVYGRSKLKGEELALQCARKNTIIIRTSAVFGRGSQKKNGNFVLNRLQDFKENKRIYMPSEQFISVTDAFDIANSVSEMISKGVGPGIYHVVNDGVVSWYELAKEILNFSKLGGKVIPVNREGLDLAGFKRPIFSALDCKKLNSFGIYMPNWRDSLHRFISVALHNRANS